MIPKIIFTALFICLVVSIKVTLPYQINQTNFEEIFKVKPDQFIKTGSYNHTTWAILFKINQCQHCMQSQMLFTNTFIEYQKRFYFEEKQIANLVQKNVQFGTIDCQLSPSLCSLFNIDKYPLLYFVSGNGEVCQYAGDQMPYRIMQYLELRNKKKGGDQCIYIGHITSLTKILGYFKPLQQFITYNTALFIIAFLIGPFLFGFVYAKTKKQPDTQPQIKKQ